MGMTISAVPPGKVSVIAWLSAAPNWLPAAKTKR
jgi:hypothetical protein